MREGAARPIGAALVHLEELTFNGLEIVAESLALLRVPALPVALPTVPVEVAPVTTLVTHGLAVVGGHLEVLAARGLWRRSSSTIVGLGLSTLILLVHAKSATVRVRT